MVAGPADTAVLRACRVLRPGTSGAGVCVGAARAEGRVDVRGRTGRRVTKSSGN
jgi:hypothetical protein